MKSLSESAAAVPTAAVAVTLTGWHRHKGVDPQHQFQRIVHGNVSHILTWRYIACCRSNISHDYVWHSNA